MSRQPSRAQPSFKGRYQRRGHHGFGLDRRPLEHLGDSQLRALIALLEAARDQDAIVGWSDEYGVRYTVDFTMTNEHSEARVRSGWIILHGESVPRLTTCFVKLE